jgi:trk system potassium uptake protein TrkH
MNARSVYRVLGFISVFVGAAMLPSAAVALAHHGGDLVPLLVSAALPIVIGTLTLFGTRGELDLGHKEGFAIVAFSWVVAAVFGMMPYLLTGVCRSVPDAFFESMSGFTTTGSTIFADVESLPHGILLWRSMTQWIGGMGIVLVGVAILPLLGVGGMQLFRAEVPGPIADRLSPRIQNTAKSMWSVYLGLTVLEVGLLTLEGMTLFEAVCHSFSTVSTGGFSTRNASIGAFNNPLIEATVVVFMFLAGVNFSLHLGLLRFRWKSYFTNEEVRLYAAVCLLAVAVITLGLDLRSGIGLGQGIRPAVFQTVSIFTTTGFGTADYLTWGFGAQLILFLLMFMGACAGSTAGGVKLMRVIILARHGLAMAKKEIHPRAIFTVRYAGKVVSDDVMLKVLGFFLFYMFVFFAVALAVALMGVDVETSLGASIATLSNIGPGLGQVGPASNYAAIPGGAKVLLALSMMMGRLELYTVLVLLSPMFWRRG